MTDKEDRKPPSEMELEESVSSFDDKGVWEKWKEFPKSVFPIFGNEFCERFSYYGMRTILTLYVVNVLGVSQEWLSEVIFHGFIVICYTSPLLGSILADGYIGKYHTILWVSLFYASGNVVLAIASSFDAGHPVHPTMDFVGLLIIALGTGGIKPCVAAFGGEQFKKGQDSMIETFFSVFYFSINAGSLISTYISPVLRVQQCFGKSTCFPAAFGLPAGLMILSVVMFVIGTPFYRRVPPKENIIGMVAKAIGKAIKNKAASKESNKEHWLDHYMTTHKCADDPKCTDQVCHKVQFLKDIKALLRVCVMYLPVPLFWALYDQQGSTWVLQAVLMDGRLGSAELLPDQMTIFNAVLILAFIPIFQGLIYPGIRKCGIDPTPLRRMTCGGFLASASFLIAMFVQFAVQRTAPVIPDKGTFSLTFINTYQCNVSISPLNGTGSIPANLNFLHIPYNSSKTRTSLPMAHGASNKVFQWTAQGPCVPNQAIPISTNISSDEKHFLSVVGPGYNGQQYLPKTATADLVKSTEGEGQFKLSLTNYMNSNFTGFLFWCKCQKDVNYDCSKLTRCNPYYTDYFSYMYTSPMNTSSFKELKPGSWRLFQFNQAGYGNTSWMGKQNVLRAPQDITPLNVWFTENLQGGIYSMIVSNNGVNNVNTPILLTLLKTKYEVADANTVTILLQVPQYVVITAAEILFSITGLEFSYSQAPTSMKSCVQAVWLLTVAGGDLIDVIIAVVNAIHDVAYSLLLFAILMAAVMVVFMLMSIFWYEYTFYVNEGDDDDEDEDEEDSLKKEKL